MTAIQWTDTTWNPVRGCARVSAGCEHCYAERQAHRFSGPGQPYEGLTVLGKHGPRWTGRARFVPDKLGEPLRWRKPRRVFVNSMSDLFHEDITDEQIAAVFGVMAACPQHTFQVLTKRPERARAWFRWLPAPATVRAAVGPVEYCVQVAQRHIAHRGLGRFRERWAFDSVARAPANVLLGVSVEDQATADERILLLLQCDAAQYMVSYEPALAAVDFGPWLERHERPVSIGKYVCFGQQTPALDWVIIGGESGPGARPFDVEWARSTIAQCREAGVPCFVKQLGANVRGTPSDPATPGMSARGRLRLRDRKGGDMSEWPEDLRVRQWAETRR